MPITPIDPVVPPRAPVTDARITNLSTRAHVTGDSPLMTGFAIRGDTSRTILVRVAGPALTAFGLSGTLAAPQLRLHGTDGAVISENAGWGGTAVLTNAFATTGAFPFAAGSADAALLVSLPPGSYTAEVLAGGGNGGVALVEIYDVDGTAAGSQLVNVSTRASVAANGGELISGFVISGTNSRQYLVRGIGPGLAKFNVTGVLGDPSLTVFNSGGVPVQTNNNWSMAAGTSAAVSAAGVGVSPGNVSVTVPGVTVNVTPGQVSVAVVSATTAAQVAAAVAAAAAAGVSATPVLSAEAVSLVSAASTVGAFPLDVGSTDAALLVTLAPGAYTVQVSGASPGQAQVGASASGTALLEIYELP